jgi:hypothetical protein
MDQVMGEGSVPFRPGILHRAAAVDSKAPLRR